MRFFIALLILLFAAGASAQVTYTQTTTEAPLQQVNQTGVPMNLGDDNSRLIPLDFTFNLFGNTYNSVFISSNGFISFTNGSNGCCNGNPLPSSFSNSIFGLWTDLISATGNPYYFSSADVFTAGWYNTNEFGTGNQFTFEISLFPNNDILVNYGNMANLTGHVGTAGIQGQQDFIQIYHGRNFSSLTGMTYLFSQTPEPPPVINCNDPEMIINPECIQQLTASISLPPADLPTFKSEPEQVPQETPLETLLAASPVEQTEEKETSNEVNVLEIAMAVASAPSAQTKTSVKTTTTQSSSSTEESRQTESGVMASAENAGSEQFTFNTQKEDAATAGSDELIAFGGSFGIAGFTSTPSGIKNDSVATLEAIGVLKPTQDKVEQSENNSPGLYDDQDQNAVLADINSNPGFNSYQSTMIFDASAWYKPEDIYKNNKINDNKRGFYFMEKGSTNTYKQMVEEQYK